MKKSTIVIYTSFTIICIMIFSLFPSIANTKDSKQTIEDGIYEIETALDSKKVLDIPNSSKNTCEKLEIWQRNSGENQKFDITYLGNGYYKIISIVSNLSLDVEGNSKRNDTNIIQYTDTGADNQQWIIKDAGNGYYNIISKSSGLYLDIYWNKTENGTKIVTYQKNNGKSQKFKFNKVETQKPTKTIENGIYQIQTALNENMVLNIENNSEKAGAKLQIYKNNNTNNQKFKVTYLENGYYSIICINSNLSLDVEGNSKRNDANIIQYDDTGADNQQWIIKDAGNGYYNIISKSSGLYLDIYWNKTENGTKIVTYQKNNGKSQKFKFNKVEKPELTKTIEEGNYKIVTALDETKVFNIETSENLEGQQVSIWNGDIDNNQIFEISYINNGCYKIQLQDSKLYLETKDNGMKNETKIVLNKSSENTNQQWIIQDAGNGYYNIISKSSELYLDIYWNKTENGTDVITYNENNGKSQKFKFLKAEKINKEKTIEDGIYEISLYSDKNKCLDIYNNSKDPGANVEIWERNNEKNQNFRIKYLGDGNYSILSVSSGKYLNVVNAINSENANVDQANKNASNQQKWVIKKDEKTESYYIISECNGLYLSLKNNSLEKGTNIQLNSKFTDDSKQKFIFTKVEIPEIEYYEGVYGKTGLKVAGKGGSDLKYLKYGKGKNVFFATFAIHGYEDIWDKDGEELIKIANDFYNQLLEESYDIAEKWTVYVFPGINLDGITNGWTNEGPGRTTLYSQAPENKGIDLNRCWQINDEDYKKFTSDRNYNGTEAFQAYEAQYLRDFLLKNKSQSGQTILVDLHGWTQQLIGDEDICKYYENQFPENDKSGVGRYGTGYLVDWARSTLGSNGKPAKTALVELPNNGVTGSASVLNKKFSSRYINATIEMLKNI